MVVLRKIENVHSNRRGFQVLFPFSAELKIRAAAAFNNSAAVVKEIQAKIKQAGRNRLTIVQARCFSPADANRAGGTRQGGRFFSFKPVLLAVGVAEGMVRRTASRRLAWPFA